MPVVWENVLSLKTKVIGLVLLAACIGLTIPARAADSSSIYETLFASKDHTIFAIAVKEAGEVQTLKTAGPFTLFAPTDAAFKKLDDATIGSIATKRDVVKRLVRAHFAAGKITAKDWKQLAGKELKMAFNTSFKIEEDKDGFRIAGNRVPVADITCSNGVIYSLDTVLPIPKD